MLPIFAVNHSENDLLTFAISRNNIDIIRFLLNNSQYIYFQDYNRCVSRAVFCKNYEIMELLLVNPSVNPTWGNNGALCRAILNKDFKMIKLLLSHPKVSLFDTFTQNNNNMCRITEINWLRSFLLNKHMIISGLDILPDIINYIMVLYYMVT